MRSENTYSLRALKDIVKGTLLGNPDIFIRSIAIDSRSLLIDEQILFFALLGDRHDGHAYVTDLYQKGIRAFVICKDKIDCSNFPDAGFIVVPNTLKALQKLSAYHRRKFSYPVIGVSGSNGKTIVKEWLYQILNQSFSIVRSPRSYNSQVGVPLSVWNMNTDANLAIIEAGISKPEEMEKLAKIIQPTFGVFTHLGDAHRENFKSKLHLLKEKIKLYTSCEAIVYCADDSIVETALHNEFGSQKIYLNWSRKNSSFFRILKENTEDSCTRIKYQCLNDKGEIVVPFTDKASLNNAITCCVLAFGLKIKKELIQEKIQKLEPIAMRLETKEGSGNCTLINDYYNSDFGSLEIAVDLMNRQQKDKKKTLILSDIYQTGISDEKLYNKLSKMLVKKKVDRFIGIGKRISSQADSFEQEASFYPSTDLFLSHLNRNQFRDEVILIKGARDFHFERISNALQCKAHRTVLEINLTAMVHNLNYFRSLLKPETKLTVMVKAFSYGSGSIEIANLLQYHQVDYLAVAIADEGVELRNAGINIPIIVMNPEPHSFETMIEYRLEPEIYNLNILREFEQELRRNMEKKYPIHLKLDTGMHRMGFMEQDIDTLISEIKDKDQFYIRSVFSHLAGADEPQHDEFTREQIDLFTRWSDKIRSAFAYGIDRHLLNSAGIERFTDAQFEMVRLGIGLYGVSPANQDKLMNVSTLKTTISQIKIIAKENTIGYGRMGILSKDTRIGIIPIGYADGFNRKLSKGVGKVLVNGKICPVIGNICMDMSMIDLSNVDANEGDSVIIFGDDYSVSKMAMQLDTIPYEILTTISRRVKRVYLQE
ncbi:bifunctional UDP-N-acetylmuramoyl-tripeptide:D-alanyl-D-alanine ligase/alanine racemase [Marinifilum sp. RC60d5]|uniref:bifunctional UDP-N-acetylmuramoyl-tripeptide:D-alanyl-D-alanine ligase/alanine racemase n=1 Tax=Marinifilum sp. RC60d5 TaxID=3458414 RepID=UPI004036E39A